MSPLAEHLNSLPVRIHYSINMTLNKDTVTDFSLWEMMLCQLAASRGVACPKPELAKEHYDAGRTLLQTLQHTALTPVTR